MDSYLPSIIPQQQKCIGVVCRVKHYGNIGNWLIVIFDNQFLSFLAVQHAASQLVVK